MKKNQKNHKPRQRTSSSNRPQTMGQEAENEKMVNDMFQEAAEDSDVEMIQGCISDSSEDQPAFIKKPKPAVAKNPPEEKKKSSVQYYDGDESSDGSYDKLSERERESSSESEEDIHFNGKKFTVTKINRQGTYDFKFLRDQEFLAKSEQQKQEFIERQFQLRD